MQICVFLSVFNLKKKKLDYVHTEIHSNHFFHQFDQFLICVIKTDDGQKKFFFKVVYNIFTACVYSAHIYILKGL